MAKLPAVIESLDKVEEPFRGAYVEKEGGGGFVLDADVEGHPATAGLRTAKDKAIADRKKAEAAAARFKDVDPERYQQLVREAEEREAAAAAGGGPPDPAKLRAKIEAEFRGQFEPVTKERDALKAQLEKHQLFDVLDAAALKSGIKADRLDDARAVYARYAKLANGKPEMLDADGEPTGMAPEKFFAEWFKEKKPWFYEGSGATGGGASPSVAGGGSGFITLTPDQAGNSAVYQEALKKVGGDHSKIKVAPAAA